MEVDCQESLTSLDLPEEIWINIFRSLDVKNVQNAQLVCKKWLDFILSDVILSGEYRFKQGLSSSQINGILAKRKKLQIVQIPNNYYVKFEYDEEQHMFDLRYVDFKVCKDLKKVICRQSVSYDFIKMPSLPEWVVPSFFWFDPYNKPESFGPESTIELSLRLSHELDLVDSSLELVAKKMTHLETLQIYLYDDLNQDDIDYILPLLKGLQHCHSLQQLEIFCNPQDANILR